MTIKEAIVKTIGKEKYNGMIEAGVSDISILENACLTAFLDPSSSLSSSAATLRTALALVWNEPPSTHNLQLDFAK